MKVKRGDVVYLKRCAYADAKVGNGRVQAGVRPMLVVSNDFGNESSDIALVVALTSKSKKHVATHAFLDTTSSLALCEQIFTISQDDIVKKIASISKKEQQIIDECLKLSLGVSK